MKLSKLQRSIPLLALLALLAFASADAATVITGVTATATTTNSASQTVDNLTNGSGLSVNNDITATHANHNNAFLQWHSSGGVVDNESVTFDLGGSYNLENIYIWQFNQTTLPGRGVNQFDLYYSTNNGGSYTAWTQNLNLAIAGTNPVGSVSAQSFAFAVNNITNVRIEIDSSHNGTTNDYVGLSEVRFTAVPEPSVALLGGLGLLLLLRRRR